MATAPAGHGGEAPDLGDELPPRIRRIGGVHPAEPLEILLLGPRQLLAHWRASVGLVGFGSRRRTRAGAIVR